MNVQQQLRYAGCWSERNTPNVRIYMCTFCRFTAQARAGRGSGNALKTVSRLRGRMMQHAREHHPEQLNGGGEV